MRPKRFALGAAMGLPKALLIARKIGWPLTRTPTVGSPLVTMSGTFAVFGKRMVRGGPEFIGKFSHRVLELSRDDGDFIEILVRSDVDDQRIKIRPFLSGENLRDGLRIESIGTQAVHCFRGQGDGLAVLQHGHRLVLGFLHAIVGGLDDFRFEHAACLEMERLRAIAKSGAGYPGFLH